MIDWRYILMKKVIRAKWEGGFMWDWHTHIDHTEDFNRDIILSKGELFIDAGAHTGMWTIPASRYYDRVIAIEPTPQTVKILQRNLKLNRIKNVDVISKALDDTPGWKRFYLWPQGSMGNSLLNTPVDYTSDYGLGLQDGVMETVTIDDLRVEPTRIKCDVEGVEDRAVSGGLNTIEKYHPDLIIEIHRRENERSIIDLLPGYAWEKNTRHMKPGGKTEFDQVHLLGIWKR